MQIQQRYMHERLAANRTLFTNRRDMLWESEKAGLLEKKEAEEREWLKTGKGEAAVTKLAHVRIHPPSSPPPSPCLP